MGEIDWTKWTGLPNSVATALKVHNDNRKVNKKNTPGDFQALTNTALSASNGDYKDRQLYELIQNAADVLTSTTEGNSGRIKVVLTPNALYCANEGRPFSPGGFEAVGTPNNSVKDDHQAIGQFGIGFMSVQEITKSPQIFSRTCSVRYSLDETFKFFCSEELANDEDTQLGRVWTMAYAIPVDPETQSAGDEILRDLMEWASTVIKLPLDRESTDRGQVYASFAEKMRKFPAEFLLFCQHVGSLEFEIRDPDPFQNSTWQFTKVNASGSRVIDNVKGTGNVHVSIVHLPGTNGGNNEWMVFSDVDIPLQEELKDLDRGLVRARKRDENGRLVPVSLTWAVNVNSPGRDRGTFWFFFPTEDKVSLKGIVNAPWDTNTGRTLLLDPEINGYNKLLLRRLAYLILTAIPIIAEDSSPDVCRYLELIPARGDEESSSASKWFVPEFWRISGELAHVPDLDGVFKALGETQIWPTDVTEAIAKANSYAVDVAGEWTRLTTRREFPHMTAFKNPVRKSRIETPTMKAPLSIEAWLELVTQSNDVERSRDAIVLAWDFMNAFPLAREEASRARVVLLADGSLARPRFGDVYLPSGGAAGTGKPLLHEKLSTDTEIVEILRSLGVRRIEDTVQPGDLLPDLKTGAGQPGTEDDWRRFWALLSSEGIEESVVEETFSVWHEIGFNLENVLIPNEMGEMVAADQVLLGGAVLGADSVDADKSWLVSLKVSHELTAKLNDIGIWNRPRISRGSLPWADEYRDFLKGFPEMKNAGRLNKAMRELPALPSHMLLLEKLTPEASALLAKSYLALFAEELLSLGEGALAKHPLLWALRTKGFLPSSMGPRRVSDILGHGLRSFKPVIPVADVSEVESTLLGLGEDLSVLGQTELDNIIARLGDESDPMLIGCVLALLAKFLPAPAEIPARIGAAIRGMSPTEVSVVLDVADLDDHIELGQPVIRVSGTSLLDALVKNWKLRESAVTGSVKCTSAEDERNIADEFPGLLQYLGETQCEKFRCCENLIRRITTGSGYRDHPENARVDGNCVYIESLDLPGAGDERDEMILRKIAEGLKLRLSDSQIREILDSRRSAEAHQREKKCRELAKRSSKQGLDLDAEILASLFTLDELLKLLPSSLINQLGDEKSDSQEAAKMALAVWGVEILAQSEAKEILRKNGHTVPPQFAGTNQARNFVRSIGLDKAYAGFPGLDRDRHVEVSPRTDSVELHDYQKVVYTKMREHFRARSADKPGWRALLYMPTGAGKTRVTVQAIVDSLNDKEFRHPRIIWIAQSDELCEQAVQTFQEVWRSTGQNGILSIERLWGSNEAVAEEFDDECAAQVVVCTYQKLAKNISSGTWHSEYEWLVSSGLVVIDEAHSAAGSAFTDILTALGFVRGGKAKDPMPLIGLTATPKERIRSRFGRMIGIDLPPGLSDFQHLKNIGVLSNVRHQEIDGIVIEAGDSPPNARQPWLGKRYDKQFESSEERNRAIIDHICGQASHDDSLILVFAASVAHAQILAALLAQRGISAAAVSAETPRRLRHHYVKEFGKGNIKVLTNFGVLTQGFDNPKVNVVYVTRPVFSAAAYLQMVGRGLRGPLNGGTEECLIVDINDNLDNFPDLELVYDKVNEWFNNDGDGDIPDDIEDDENGDGDL